MRDAACSMRYVASGNACRIQDSIYMVGMRIFSLSATKLQRVNMPPCHSVLQRLHFKMEQEDLLVITMAYQLICKKNK